FSNYALAAPDCFPATNLLWYKFQLTGGNHAIKIQSDVPGEIAAFMGNQQIGCTSDASTDPVIMVAQPNTEVCLAFNVPLSISQLDISQVGGENCESPITVADGTTNVVGNTTTYSWDFPESMVG